MTELVWAGKYDDQGNLRPVERTILPFQVVETVNESKVDREKAQRDFWTLMARDDTWRNMLIWGDNKVVMSSLLPRLAGKINLIYIDPPFATGQDFSFRVRVGDEEFIKEPSIIEEKAYRDTWGRGLDSYLQMMYERLVLMRELMAESGSIYIHIGWDVSHYIKGVLDEVFRPDRCINQIIWKRQTAHSDVAQGARHMGRLHDVVFLYAKGEQYTWNMQFQPYHEEYAKAFYKYVELDTGRRYQLSDLTAPGGATKGNPYYEFLGVTRYWRFSKERMEELYKQGKVVQTSPDSVPRQKRYLDEMPGVPLQDIWTDIKPIQSQAGERLGYDTQKPEALLDRIIKLSSNEGDLVADFFCVRKGTQVWKVDPPIVPPHAGGQNPFSLPVCGEGWGGGSLIPIESLQPGDWVLAHEGQPHRVLRTIPRPYKGLMIGIKHHESPVTLWLTADHRVLAKRRPRSLGGHADWSAVPFSHLERRKELRREMTPPERKLWQVLRREALGAKFRRQHPIGPYIADFYSREAQLVVEVDGASAHSNEDAMAHDRGRDAFMQSLGLRVLRIPAIEVEHNLEGVFEAIQEACQQQGHPEGAEWVEAADLCKGDVIFTAPHLKGVRIEHIVQEFSEEEVYDLEVEAAHSYMTEVCAIHNCGSGTTLAVAEKLGRRWIGCDLSKWAIQVTRKRLLQIEGCKPFDMLNLGNYERHKLATNGHWERYVLFILQLYRAEAVSGFRMLHGKKARAYVHVGSVDSPVTMREIRQTLKEAQEVGVREVHFLGWDFEMGLHDLVRQVGEDHDVKVRLVSIPRESLEVTDPAREEVRFFDLNYLELEHTLTPSPSPSGRGEKGVRVTVRLKDFIIANPEYLPEEVQAKIKKFTDYIDYWAVDWDYKDDTFHNGWQSFRTRKDPKLATKASHTYDQPGTYKVLVKVVDIFGNDTTKMVEIQIPG